MCVPLYYLFRFISLTFGYKWREKDGYLRKTFCYVTREMTLSWKILPYLWNRNDFIMENFQLIYKFAYVRMCIYLYIFIYVCVYIYFVSLLFIIRMASSFCILPVIRLNVDDVHPGCKRSHLNITVPFVYVWLISYETLNERLYLYYTLFINNNWYKTL